MGATRNLLLRAEHLSTLGVRSSFEPGERIARGFADLGFEEFTALGNGKIVSLYTGEKSSVSEPERQHFFLVPDVDWIANELFKRGQDLNGVRFDQGRAWEVAIEGGESFRARTLIELFLELLIYVLSGERFVQQEGRTLSAVRSPAYAPEPSDV